MIYVLMPPALVTTRFLEIWSVWSLDLIERGLGIKGPEKDPTVAAIVSSLAGNLLEEYRTGALVRNQAGNLVFRDPAGLAERIKKKQQYAFSQRGIHSARNVAKHVARQDAETNED